MIAEKSQSTDVIITGAGIAGLALGCVLGLQGVNVTIIDPQLPESIKKTPVSGRTIALMLSSLNVIRAAGLNHFPESHGTPMRTMRLIDDSIRGQPIIQSEFEASEIGLPCFGMNIPNNLLRASLFEQFCALPGTTFHKTSLAGFSAGNLITATLADGKILKAPLIIGADGRNSPVRKIARIETWKKEYGQTAITCIINHSRSHNNTSTEFHRTGGPFALVPMLGNQSAVVWVDQTEKAQTFLKLRRAEFEQALQERTNNILGGITLETTPEGWPLCSIKAKRLIAPRVALMAEAAHVMSPIAAQGLNLSLRDAATLAETIIDALRLGLDAGSETILKSYERRRTADIATRVLGVNTMNQLVSTEYPALKDLRRSGLKLTSRIPALKRFAMTHGLAPALDQDRILKGIAV